MSEPSTADGAPLQATVDLDSVPYDAIGEAVVSAVAAYTGTEIDELDSLTSSVDPDALEDLCDDEAPGASSRVRTIRFEYQGLVVSVVGCETLGFEPIEATHEENATP